MDPIDRAIAVDAVQRIKSLATLPDNDAVVRMSAVEYVLYHLPSAQPEIIRCKDCKWFGDIGCAINIVDDSDRPTEMDFCSFAERREE